MQLRYLKIQKCMYINIYFKFKINVKNLLRKLFKKYDVKDLNIILFYKNNYVI